MPRKAQTSHCIHVNTVRLSAMQMTPCAGTGLGVEESERKHFWALPSPGGRWGQEGLRTHQVHDPSRQSPAPCSGAAGFQETPTPHPSLFHVQGHRPAVTAGSGLGLNTAIPLSKRRRPLGQPSKAEGSLAPQLLSARQTGLTVGRPPHRSPSAGQ